MLVESIKSNHFWIPGLRPFPHLVHLQGCCPKHCTAPTTTICTRFKVLLGKMFIAIGRCQCFESFARSGHRRAAVAKVACGGCHSQHQFSRKLEIWTEVRAMKMSYRTDRKMEFRDVEVAEAPDRPPLCSRLDSFYCGCPVYKCLFNTANSVLIFLRGCPLHHPTAVWVIQHALKHAALAVRTSRTVIECQDRQDKAVKAWMREERFLTSLQSLLEAATIALLPCIRSTGGCPVTRTIFQVVGLLLPSLAYLPSTSNIRQFPMSGAILHRLRWSVTIVQL
jgi:hypothetical protein